MNETTIAIQENVLEGPSLFSNNPRTMKNLAMIALTTAGTVKKQYNVSFHTNQSWRSPTIQHSNKRSENAILEIGDAITEVCKTKGGRSVSKL